MANFGRPVFTDVGRNLYYRNMAGTPLVITKIQLGSGESDVPISSLTALKNPVITVDAAYFHNSQYAKVTGGFSNAGLTEPFYWREIGVLVADPDYPEDRTKDILYCYQRTDTPDLIPVASVQTVEKHVTVPILVDNAANVSCLLDSSLIWCTWQDLEDHNAASGAHFGIFVRTDEKGQPGGVAELGSDGKVPQDQLPEMDYVKTAEKGLADGVATLDSTGKVPSTQLPGMNYEPLGAVETHNNSMEAHPGLFGPVNASVNDHEARILRLEDSLYNDITGNPHSITFESLEGLVVTGVWNVAQARLEC